MGNNCKSSNVIVKVDNNNYSIAVDQSGHNKNFTAISILKYTKE